MNLNACIQTTSSLRIYVLNPTSLAKKDGIAMLESELKSLNIDVAMICETWFSCIHSDSSVNIDGYLLYRKDRPKRKGGGVCVYIRNTFNSDVYNTGVNSCPLIEILWVRFTRMNCKEEYFVGCVYNPPKPLYDCNDFKGLLIGQIENIFTKSTDPTIILAGDVNQMNTNFIEIDLGLKQIVNEPTHCGHILDKVFVNRPDLYEVSVHKSVIKTKHSALLISNAMTQKLLVDSSKRKKVPLYDTRQINIDKLRYLLGMVNWSPVYYSNNIQSKYDNFLSVVKCKMGEAIPVKTVTVGPRDPPFVTPLVKNLLNKRRNFLRKGKMDEANVLAQKINDMIANIRAHNFNKLSNASSKQLWNTIKPKSNKNSTTCSPPILQDVNYVNSYFANISYDINDNPDYDKARLDISNNCISHEDLLTPVNVEVMLRKLKTSAPGADSIPSWVFKKCSYELSNVICHIFNFSLLDGELPDQWRRAIVTPIPKVPKPHDVCDYRPISVTPILSRLIEKYIVKTFIRPNVPSNIFENQFAFRPTGSTTSALVYTLHHVTRLLETNSYVRCLLIDFSKAFDLIDHTILLTKIGKLNLPSNVYKWIVSFLNYRSQVLSYNNVLSDACSINKGIVQGSGLGPTLFSIMVSDLETLSVINILCKYADDTNLISPEHSDVSLEDEFSNICNWASENKMILNNTKTKEIVFRRPNPRLSIMPSPMSGIERVKSSKLLGIILNETLKFDDHISATLSQCSQRLYMLKQIKNQGLCIQKLDIIFQALIVSKLVYALSAWGGFLSANLCNIINAFFKRAHKYQLVSKIFCIRELLNEADKKLFQNARGSSHCLFNLFPTSENVTYDLRARGHSLPLPSIHTELHKKSFINRTLFTLR